MNVKEGRFKARLRLSSETYRTPQQEECQNLSSIHDRAGARWSCGAGALGRGLFFFSGRHPSTSPLRGYASFDFACGYAQDERGSNWRMHLSPFILSVAERSRRKRKAPRA